MRQAVVDYIKTLDLGKFSLSTELPYDENDTPVYIKNPRRIYVGQPNTVSDPFIQTLGGTTISNETTAIQVFLSSDAKLVPATYNSVVEQIKGAKDLTTIQGINRREVEVTIEYVNDLAVTTVELRYIKIT